MFLRFYQGGMPLKLKYNFETVELDDRMVAVAVGDGASEFRSVIKLNDTAAEIFEMLKYDTTEEAIIAALKEHYGDDPEIPGYVHEFISGLKAEGVLG